VILCYVWVNSNMFVIEIIPLYILQRSQKKTLSFYHTENLPAGSLVQVLFKGKKTKAVVINSQSMKLLKVRIKKEAGFELKPINKVLEINQDPEHFDIAFLLPAKKETSEKKVTKTSESAKAILGNYLEKLAERKAASKAKTYMQETAEPYLKYIDWENDTFEEDMRLFWVTASNYYKSHTHHNFVKVLDWIKKKDSLNPKQVAKLFNKE